MPWKTSSPVDLRFELITRLKRGERMTDLCREYELAEQVFGLPVEELARKSFRFAFR